MPRYNINGKWHVSPTALSDDDLEELTKSSSKVDTSAVQAKPAEPKSTSDKIWDVAKTVGSRLLNNDTPEAATKRRLDIISSYPEGSKGRQSALDDPKTGNIIGTPESEGSIFPKLKQPETWLGGAANSLYNDFVRPLGTPSGFMGMMRPKPVPQVSPNITTGPVNLDPHLRYKALNPAPPKVERPTSFYNGPAGTTQTGKLYPMDTAPLHPPLESANPQVLDAAKKNVLPTPGGTVLPREVEGLTNLDPITAANRGTKLGDIQSIDTSSPQGALRSNAKAISGEPVKLPTNAPIDDIEQPYRSSQADSFANTELPHPDSRPFGSTKNKSTGSWDATREPKSKPQGFDATTPEIGVNKPLSANSGSGIVENYANATPSTPTTAKDAVKVWADGNRGATYRGKIAADQFTHLSDPTLIDKFESGDRSGGLKDLETYFEQKHKEGVAAGLFKEDQKVLNYIRHEYENTPEEIQAAMKRYVPEKSTISKKRGFPTYQQAESQGLTRKYQTIPELVQSYETKFNRALKNKQFYDYLKKTDQVVETISDKPNEWTFRGPNAPELKKLVSNVLGESPELLKTAGDAASVTKNIYLSGGIPGTKYNMHQWNIAKNDIALNGYKSGLKKLFTDPTGKKAEQWLTNLPKEDKLVLADLADNGWQGHPMADTGHNVNLFEKGAAKLGKTPTGRVLDAAGKVLDVGQKAFEDPLFKRSLPSLGAQRTLEAYKRLLPEMGKEQALKAAAKIGNDFYGGVDTILRNPVYKDLGRIGFLAPNWMESQLTKAVSQWKGAAKTLTGTGNASDKIYAKSLARSATLPGIGALTGGAVMSSRGGDIGAIHMGQDSAGKDRTMPTLTTANEEFRIPVTAPIQTMMGNPAALKDLLIKNRISTPAKAVINMVIGKDDMGNPLSGKDKFGQDISFGKGLMNYGAEAARPFEHQALQSLIGYLKGSMSAEEATARGLELPVNYSKPR